MDQKDVSYIVFESVTTKLERTIEKLWILAIILVLLLVGTNAGWLYYESQFKVEETTTVTQGVDATADDSSDLNINTVGGDYNGSEGENKTDRN